MGNYDLFLKKHTYVDKVRYCVYDGEQHDEDSRQLVIVHVVVDGNDLPDFVSAKDGQQRSAHEQKQKCQQEVDDASCLDFKMLD